jgi:hypothetical protein
MIGSHGGQRGSHRLGVPIIAGLSSGAAVLLTLRLLCGVTDRVRVGYDVHGGYIVSGFKTAWALVVAMVVFIVVSLLLKRRIKKTGR